MVRSETINSMSSKLLEMNFMVLRMILESFGLMEKYYESHLENTSSVFRLMKYKVPPPSDGGTAIGLVPHTDKNSLTILFQNDVQGLDVLTKQGNWVQLEIPEGSFTVIVGDTLKVIKLLVHLIIITPSKLKMAILDKYFFFSFFFFGKP